MTKYNTYQAQTCDNAPLETFSNKPLKVNGITLTPTWSWSNAFRKAVRASYAKGRDNNQEGRAELYKDWFKAKFNREYDGAYT